MNALAIAMLLLGGSSEPSRSELRRAEASFVVAFDPSKAQTVSLSDAQGRTLWQGVPSRWRPWRCVVANLEGDRSPEIVVALNKSTSRLPFRHRTLFVYQFDGKTVSPKWRGSSLGADFDDFEFVIQSGRHFLFVTQILPSGKRALARMEWNGFGFRRTQVWGPFDELRIDRNGGRKIALGDRTEIRLK